MREAIWMFGKQRARLTLQRGTTGQEEGQPLLIIARDGGVREIAFANDETRAGFHADMETFLLRTGWTLAAFSPDQRTHTDRRTFPRETLDRRRWWTDIAPGDPRIG